VLEGCRSAVGGCALSLSKGDFILMSLTPCSRLLESVAPSSLGSRPSPAGGLRPALTPAAGGAFQSSAGSREGMGEGRSLGGG
jgi:hypothetical protein